MIISYRGKFFTLLQMINSFQSILNAIANSSNEDELRLRFMDTAGGYFGAKHWGFYLLNDNYRPTTVDIQGLPDSFIDHYEQVGRDVDPVMRFVTDRHTPAHEQSVLTAEAWKQSSVYQHVGSRYDHEHAMIGPLVGGGHLIGTVNFARGKHTSAFSADNLIDLGALCAHMSACLATWRNQSPKVDSLLATNFTNLTKREQEVTALVAKGLSNAEISTQLFLSENGVKQALKRIFRKLKVSTRTKLTAQLALHPYVK